MTRVLIGDALVNEDPRLQSRINQLHDKLEAALKQCLRVAAAQPDGGTAEAEDTGPRANALLCYVVGRWHQFAKSGFKRKPAEGFERQWPLLA
jgi:TetR/AcrR family transcriptional regulator